jgi:hypothetical protein
MGVNFLLLAIVLPQLSDSVRPVAVLDIQGQINLPSLYWAPDVVVYSNGLVIYETPGKSLGEKQFRSVTITAAQMRELLPPDQVIALVEGDTVPRQDTALVHPHAPFYVLHLWHAGVHRRVVIHGELSMGSASFTQLVERLAGFTSDKARPWVPDSIEIGLRRVDHECNPTTAVPWPAALPRPAQLPDTTVIRFKVASSHLGRVKDLLKKHGTWDCTPVLLEGRWWGFSYDFPYPGQAAWLAN